MTNTDKETSEKVRCRLATGRWRSVFLAVLGVALAAAGRTTFGQEAVLLEILLPADIRAKQEQQRDEDKLASAVLRALDAGSSIRHANSLRERPDQVAPVEAAIALISISAPERISRRQWSGNRARLSPVADFDAFCDAIDYAEILTRDDRRRFLKIRIAPGQLTRENLVRRARITGRGAAIADLFDGEQSGRMPGLPANLRAFGAGSKTEPDDEYAVGDRVEVQISEWLFPAVVESLIDDDKNLWIVLTDVEQVAAQISDRALKRKLQSRKTLAIVAPMASLHPVATAAANDRYPFRTWQDTSGRFSVEAALVSQDGGRVQLRRESGEVLSVPIAKLSPEDLKYLADPNPGSPDESNPENPFASETEEPQRRGLHRRVSRKRVRDLGGEGFDRWSFKPAATAPTEPARIAKSVIDLTDLPNSQRFFEEIEAVEIARDGSTAIVARKSGGPGRVARRHVQMVSATKGMTTGLFETPKDYKVLDVLPERGLVLMRRDAFGLESNQRVFVQQISREGLKPVTQWAPYINGPKDVPGAIGNVDDARFLAGGRVLTNARGGKAWTIWRLNEDQAVAEYEFLTPHVGQVGFTLSPDRRYLALASNTSISIIDTKRGSVDGVLRTGGSGAPGESIGRMAFSPDLRWFAATSWRGLTVWDLRDGERRCEVWRQGITSFSPVVWAEGFALTDNRYLIDPERRILLWEYKLPQPLLRGETRLAGGRLWCVPKAEQGLQAYLASIAAPHTEVFELAGRLGSPESLLVAQPGDAVSIRVDVEPKFATETDVRSALTERLQEAGFRVVESTDLVVVATCKALERQEVRINMSKSIADPDEWDIVTRTIVPYVSRVSIQLDGEEVWAQGSVAQPGHTIWIEEGETLNDALKRLTTPNIDSVLEARFPSHVARWGEANEEGAYGVSELNPLKQMADSF